MLRQDPSVETPSKLDQFKIRLMECALSPQDDYKLDQPSTALNLSYATTSDKDGVANSFRNSLCTMPKLKTMMELREHKQFHKLFMQNQLCRNILKAIQEIKSRG